MALQLSRKATGNLYSFVFVVVLSITLLGCSSTKKSSSQNATINKVIETARSYTGVPYKWGGTTRAGMDCSGLLLIAFQSAGIDIPRTSKAQSKMGKGVSIHNLQPGDLVFFKANKYSGKITHVGLVTEVRDKRNVRFIHASTKLGVVENNIFTDYYHNIFAKARRPF